MKHDYLTTKSGDKIAYHQIPGKSPGVLFLSGFLADMGGTKASHLARTCETKGQAFLRFDYFGHGRSSGHIEQGTIGKWKENALEIFDSLTQGPQIVVGSSLGGWLMFLLAQERKERIKGMVGIAAAPDFTANLMDMLDPVHLKELQHKGVCYLASLYSDAILPIAKSMIEEARHHHLLEKNIDVHCPIRLLHGTQDEQVPWEKSLKLLEKVQSNDARLILVKNANHRLSTLKDLELLDNTVFELINDSL